MLQCTAKMDESEQDSDSGPAGTGHISGVEKLSVFLLLTSTMILKTPSLNPKGSLHTEKYRANLGCPVGVGTRGPWPCWDTRCPGALCNVHVPHAHRESQLDVSIHLVKTRLQEKAIFSPLNAGLTVIQTPYALTNVLALDVRFLHHIFVTNLPTYHSHNCFTSTFLSCLSVRSV
jgi:hypothetical protein